jgi:hypothetical protein
MGIEDIAIEHNPVASLAPVVVTAAVAGAGVDTSEYEAAELILLAGVMGGSATPTVNGRWEDSPDNSVWTAIAAGLLSRGGLIPALVAGNQSTVFKRGYLGTQRYVRWNVTSVSGTAPSQPESALVLLGRPRSIPTPDTA